MSALRFIWTIPTITPGEIAMSTNDLHGEALGRMTPGGQLHRAYHDDHTPVCKPNGRRKVTILANDGALVPSGHGAIMSALLALDVDPDKLCRQCFGHWVRHPYAEQRAAMKASQLTVTGTQAIGTATVATLSDGRHLSASNHKTPGPCSVAMTAVSWLDTATARRTYIWSRKGSSHRLAIEETLVRLNAEQA
jgi:hypothetical protein